ncbi:MAG: hypothetical protein ACE5DK_04960 [Paracoccaceae bacterium]
MRPEKVPIYLQKIGDRIARAIDPDHHARELDATIVRTGDASVTLDLTLGDKTARARLFGDDAASISAFEREHQALRVLHATAVPRLLLALKSPRFIMTDVHDGRVLAGMLNPATLTMRAEHLGQWFGLLANVAPSAPGTGSWADYAMEYKGDFNPDILERHMDLLRDVPLGKTTLALNDGSPDHFILGPDKRLYAVSLEYCRMKPEGWDLILAARALFHRFPDRLREISDALVRGYLLSARKPGLGTGFADIAVALVLAGTLAPA